MTRILIVVITLLLGGCGYNTLQSMDEQVKAAWSEVINQYQRRADLIPNLVNTVKGFAAQEQQVLLGVTNARARVGAIQATPELVDNPEAFQRIGNSFAPVLREASGSGAGRSGEAVVSSTLHHSSTSTSTFLPDSMKTQAMAKPAMTE